MRTPIPADTAGTRLDPIRGTTRKRAVPATANHEIPAIDRTDAEDVLSFTETLLKVNYEMPARAAGGASGDESAPNS